jgi:two-component system, cell cycle response regulator DivK
MIGINAHCDRQAPSVTVSPTEPIASEPASHARILLIEDNDINRRLLSEYLVYFHYDVIDLPDGTNLFGAIAEIQPDIILLDLKLPHIDGFQLLSELSQHPQWSRLPVIVVSAFAFVADQKRALALGARRYFVKPINPLLLREAIQAELEQS